MRYRSGDIILFSGRGFFSWLIKKATHHHISHVGIVVRIEGEACILESTSMDTGCEDVFSGRRMTGCQVSPLQERVDSYDGDVYLAKLHLTPKSYDEAIQTVGETVNSKMIKFAKNAWGKPYEQSRLELVRSAIDCWFSKENRPNKESYFCSELVVDALRYVFSGLYAMEEHIAANEVTPADLFDAALGAEDVRGLILSKFPYEPPHLIKGRKTGWLVR